MRSEWISVLIWIFFTCCLLYESTRVKSRSCLLTHTTCAAMPKSLSPIFRFTHAHSTQDIVASANRGRFLRAGAVHSNSRNCGKMFRSWLSPKKIYILPADGWRRVISCIHIYIFCDWITAHGMNWDNMFIISGCIHVTLNYLPLSIDPYKKIIV